MKTAELQGAALDWAVATANGDKIILAEEDWHWYSTDWAQGGPIIEREEICVLAPVRGLWRSSQLQDRRQWPMPPSPGRTQYGPTPLIAAMRCYVASKLGDEVEIPEGLK